MKPFLFRHPFVAAGLVGALLAGLSGCKIQKQGEGANKNVDIETPVGSIHVNTQVDPKDTGLAVYPGATRAEDEEHKHAANLTMDSSLFGMKVVAIKFHSDDPPDKLIDFYRNQLKAYGDVTECHGNAVIKRGGVSCLHAPRDQTDLVAGTEERHHAVSVKPDGKGSTFELVYIQTRGEKETL